MATLEWRCGSHGGAAEPSRRWDRGVTRRREPLTVRSGGADLDGWIDVPQGSGPFPVVIVCSGYQGLKEMQPARFGRFLAPRGFACVAFDYRGFGTSGGEPGRLVPQEQVEDVRAVIAGLRDRPTFDSDRLALVGWALGGGIAVAAAAGEPVVRAVAAVNAVADCERSLRCVHDPQSWERLRARISADRRGREAGTASEAVPPFEVLPLDPVTRRYVDAELEPHSGFDVPITLEAAEQLLAFRPADVVHRLAPRPLLLVHGRENGLHQVEESRELYARAGDPKRLVILEGAGHTEWMHDDHPTFRHVAGLIADFLVEPLGAPGSARRESA